MSSLFEHCRGEKRTISSFTRQLVNSLTYPLVNFPTRQLPHSSTSQLVNFSTRQLLNSSTSQLVNFPTCQLVNLSTCQLVNHCNLFSKNFNIMSALFATNRSPCRKKSILAKVCFDANKG